MAEDEGQPTPERTVVDVQLICPECSEMLEIHDIAAFALTQHIRDACAATEQFFAR